ncbi:MAG TPA: hypothetical protein VHP14_21150, partial [Anaerolineales bacterium]|nr:hypothetical protein [Anaerolineales bacterium]
MKQQFTFLIVVSIGVLALSGIIVGDAKAARDLPPVPDVPSTDHLPLLRQTTDGWTCYVSPAGCPDPNDPVLPYIDEGSKDGWGFNAS